MRVQSRYGAILWQVAVGIALIGLGIAILAAAFNKSTKTVVEEDPPSIVASVGWSI